MTRAAALFALLLAAPLAAQAPADSLHPYQPGIDVLHYGLALDLPETGSRIEGIATLTVARAAGVDTLTLDLRTLDVASVRIDGVETPFRRDTATIHIPLPRQGGDRLRVEVRYAGEPTDGLVIRSDHGWTAFGDNWPNRARHWIPSVDHPSDKATVTWTITAPADREVLANGLEEERTELPGRRKRVRWVSSRPLATYMMVIGAGPLERTELGESACGMAERPGCILQTVHTLPGTARNFLPGPFAEADEIVEHFARLVAPFPYERLAHVQSATRFGGMENATAIFYSDRQFREGTLGLGLVAHETAHQWFGDAVTPREWSHLWLSEGFATYFAQLYTEHAQGAEAFRAGMAGMAAEIHASEAVRTRPVIDTEQTDLMALLNENSYEKGAWVLHMLRAEVGDSTFFRGIRGYYAAHRHGTALTAHLQGAMERAAGRELGWFFDQWLRRPGVPLLSTETREDPETRRLSLRVTQHQEGAPYRFPLTVELVDERGLPRRATVEVEAVRDQWVPLPIERSGPVRSLRLDPEGRLLFRELAGQRF